jgi:hypothetical protein
VRIAAPLAAGLVLLVLAPQSGAADGRAVAAELWDRPRGARAILAEPRVRQAVQAWAAQSGARLVIRHAPVQDAAVQAEELRDWLVALAVDPERTSVRSGLAPGEPLRLEVEP